MQPIKSEWSWRLGLNTHHYFCVCVYVYVCVYPLAALMWLKIVEAISDPTQPSLCGGKRQILQQKMKEDAGEKQIQTMSNKTGASTPVII